MVVRGLGAEGAEGAGQPKWRLAVWSVPSGTDGRQLWRSFAAVQAGGRVQPLGHSQNHRV